MNASLYTTEQMIAISAILSSLIPLLKKMDREYVFPFRDGAVRKAGKSESMFV